jgi:hypothetical protein
LRLGDFDLSQLYSDEGPPIGDVAAELWVEAASKTVVWPLRQNIAVAMRTCVT